MGEPGSSQARVDKCHHHREGGRNMSNPKGATHGHWVCRTPQSTSFPWEWTSSEASEAKPRDTGQQLIGVCSCHETQRPHSRANVAGMFSFLTETHGHTLLRKACDGSCSSLVDSEAPSLYGRLEKQIQLPPLGAPLAPAPVVGKDPKSSKVTSGQLFDSKWPLQ